VVTTLAPPPFRPRPAVTPPELVAATPVPAPVVAEQQETPLPVWQFVLRIFWVAVQILAAIVFMKQGTPFFYQGF
jgi:hypothetical protein